MFVLNVFGYSGIVTSKGMSGGTRIFIECAKHWIKKGVKINLFTCKESQNFYIRNGIRGINFIIWPSLNLQKFGIFSTYFFRAIIGGFKTLSISLNKDSFIYSGSDFWPDSIPAMMMKLRNPKSSWIASFYLFAPKPWQKDNPYKGKRFLTGLFYWLTQLPIYWIVKRYADFVFVTSEPDVEKFVTKKRCRDKIVVVQGGVDIKPSKKYLNLGKVIPLGKRKYDACFVGRFHYQKGVLDLVNIWKYVCDKKPDAKLAMIGIGPLEKDIKRKIKKLGLENNIELHGFKDGEEKYEVFKQSKIVIHPATYDSGGMAACEAMAWGLPGVSFDLESLKTYYPKGMLKTSCYDLKSFADNILELFKNKELYNKISREAIELAKEWDWDKRARKILKSIWDI